MTRTVLVRVTGTAACLLMGLTGAAGAQTLRLLRPINGAIVRETIPVRVPAGDLPADGYVSISVDGKFRTARVLPDSKTAPIYQWDTKAPFATPDDPNTKTYLSDGPHTLSVKLYDRAGKNLGESTVTVRVANKIAVPAQGLKLAYRWRSDQQQKFSRQTELDIIQSGPDQTLQSSSLTFTRTVEDSTGASILLRDHILPGGSLTRGTDTQDLGTLYLLKSKYRSVDNRGDILGSMAPLSPGDHFGFSIPVLPARRVAIGDSWQDPVDLNLEWASSTPTVVQAESRLEGFEWQDGYPTAKIRETFSGAATFNLASASATPVSASSVNYERVVYFAYGSGRLVRTETTMTVTTDTPLTGIGTSPNQTQFNGGLPDSPGNAPGGFRGPLPGSPGFIPPSVNPGGGGYPQPNFNPKEGGYPQPNFNPGGGGYPQPNFNPGGGGYPQPNFNPGQPPQFQQPQQNPATPVTNNYKVTETTTLAY